MLRTVCLLAGAAVAALRSAGKSSKLLLFKGLDHQLEDSEARALILSRVGTLLDRTIGH